MKNNRLSYRGGAVERLEDRRLLAITATFTGTALSFVSDGNPADSELTITAANDAGDQVTFSSATDTINVVGTAPAALTEINVDLGGGTDSLTINGSAGANLITINGLDVDFGVVDYDLTGVENLTVDGQGGIDTISATGASVTGTLLINGNTGVDLLSVSGPFSSGALTIQDTDSSPVSINGNITTSAAGGQSYQTGVVLTAATTLDAGTGDIRFLDTLNGAFSLNANSTSTTLFSATNIGSLATNAGGQTVFNATGVSVAITTAADQLYNDPVLLNGDAILTSTAGNITFADVVDAADNGVAGTSASGLTVNTPAGDNIFNGEVGGDNQDALTTASDADGLEFLITDATTVSGQTKFNVASPLVAVVTTLNQDYNDPVILRQDTTLTSTGNNIAFHNVVDAEDDGVAGVSLRGLTVNTPAGNNAFSQAVGGDNQNLLTTPSDVDGLEFLITDATGAAGQTILQVATPLVAVRTTNEQNYGDQLQLNADIILTAIDNNDADAADDIADGNDNIIFQSGISALADNAQSLVVNAADITRFGGNVGTSTIRLESITLDAAPLTSSGTTEFGNPVGGTPLTVNTALSQLYQEPVVLNADTTLVANLNAASNVTFQQTVRSAIDGANGLVVNATGDTTFNAKVGDNNQRLEFLRTDEAPFTASGATRIAINTAAAEVSINTTGDQTYNDPVTLNSSTNFNVLASATGSVTFNNTLNSFQLNEEDLVINAGANAAFNGVVGGAANGRLDDLEVNAGNSVTLDQLNVTNTVDLLAATGSISESIADGTADVLAIRLLAQAGLGINLDTTIQNLTVISAGGTVDIDETNDLTVESVTATNQIVDLTANGTILDDLDAAPDVVAGSLILLATGGIRLDTTVGTLTATNNTAGNIDIDETDAVQVNQITALVQTVDLNAGGAITQDGDGAADVVATTLLLQATGGITLDTTIAALTATNNTSGGVTIVETDDLQVTLVTATAQTVSLSAGGLINEDADPAAADVVATSLVLQAVNGIVLDTTVADLTATNTTTGGIDIDETDALQIKLVIANGQLVDITTGGAISEDGDAAADVVASSLVLQATGGINVGTSIDNLIANNDTSGDVSIFETFGINVQSLTNTVGNVNVVAAGGAMNLLTVASGGFLVASTSDAAAAGDDLTVNGSVQAQSFVSLIAGDDVVLTGASNVRAVNQFVYMKVDAATVDTAGGRLILLGRLEGNNALQYPLVAEGDTGDDLFSIQNFQNTVTPANVLKSPIAILARGGSLDNTFIVFTDAPEDIRAFATIVDIAGQSFGGINPIEITYVDNEQLDLVTLGGDDKVFVQMPEPIHGILANIIRTSTGAGDDSLKINGSTLSDVIRVNSYTNDPNFRFQVRGDTGETECLQVFGFNGNDIIENSAPISSLLDGGNGQDFIMGGNSASAYDVIFGGADVDQMFARAGNDFIYADHDFNNGAPVLTIASGEIINSGTGNDVIIALGGDSVRRDPGDFESDVIVGQGVGLSINDFLFAQLLAPSDANINAQLQAGLNKKCAMPIP